MDLVSGIYPIMNNEEAKSTVFSQQGRHTVIEAMA
jgi:hypothetical protein